MSSFSGKVKIDVKNHTNLLVDMWSQDKLQTGTSGFFANIFKFLKTIQDLKGWKSVNVMIENNSKDGKMCL